MKSLAIAFALLVLPALLLAQPRQFGVGALLIDDNAGHSIRLVAPAGLTTPVTDWVLPLPPPGITAGFVEAGSVANPYLRWNSVGSYWQATNAVFNFPYSQTGSSASTLFSLTQTGTGSVANFSITNASDPSTALVVSTSGPGTGVMSNSFGGQALWGITGSSFAAAVLADNVAGGEAVTGRTSSAVADIGAVVGRNDGAGPGVKGFNTMSGYGIYGVSGFGAFAGHPATSTAGRFENLLSTNNADVLQVVSNGTGKGLTVTMNNGSSSADAINVANSGNGTGAFVSSFGGQGVWGITGNSFSAAVLADNTGGGEAVTGRTSSAVAGTAAVVGRNDGAGPGLKGFNTMSGYGIYGVSGFGAFAGHPATSTAGRFENMLATNSADVLQVVSNGTGKGFTVTMNNGSSAADAINVANFGSGTGAFVSSFGGQGLWGITGNSFSAAVLADNTGGGEAVTGRTNSVAGIAALVGRNDGAGDGVKGFTTGTGYGIWGVAGTSSSTGIAGKFENINGANTSDVLQVVQISTGRAANITGDVLITGNLTVTGAVAKGSGSFMIDHPLDPKNKILYHSFVESPDMKNIYDGVVKLDAQGRAIVTMPDWFDAVNGDFRYQLTSIGAPGPGLYVAREIDGNTFEIAGGTPNTKVSWQVTGIRHDAYANAHRMQVEVDKPAEQRGSYIHPEAYGVESRRASETTPQAVTASSNALDANAVKTAMTPVKVDAQSASAPHTPSASALDAKSLHNLGTPATVHTAPSPTPSSSAAQPAPPQNSNAK